jgi:hypothetical protein
MAYPLKYLQKRPTLAQDMTGDLKVETPRRRVWLARTTVADGEPYNHRVTVEALKNGKWVILEEYPAAQEED